MKQIKVKGIIIRETNYKDNDKILTVLTDKLGKISCIAKGSKKNNSPLLACSQYLVYSEMLLYRSNNFYYLNSAEILSTFYNFRIDFDKLQVAFEITRIINFIVSENEDTEKLLTLFLNTIFLLDNKFDKKDFIKSVFEIKMFSLLGFLSDIGFKSANGQAVDDMYYDYVSNSFIEKEAYNTTMKNRCILLKKSTILAIKFIVASDIKKVFDFQVADVDNLKLFTGVYQDVLTNGI